MIKLFGKTDKSFISNGDAVLRPKKATIKKEDNGDYYLDITTGLDAAPHIVKGNIIVAPTPQGEQAFRIDNPQKTKSQIQAKAWHIFYDSKNYVIADAFAEAKTCDGAIKWMNNATEPTSEFTVGSDISTINSYRCVRGSLNEAIMTILDRWGGHLVRDNFSIQIKESLAVDKGKVIRYRKNLRDISCSENWDNVVTKILPVGKDGILLNGVNPSASIYISSSVQYEIPYTKSVSFEQDINQEDYPTETAYKQALVNDLRTKATAYLEKNCVPEVNYTLKANIEDVEIGEVIQVIDERLGISIMTQVIGYEYDCILEKYIEVEFGNFKKSLSGLIPNITNTVTSGVDKQISNVASNLQDEINSANTAIEEIGTAVSEIVNTIYPVGSIYMSMNSTSPASLFGGTWVQIKDTFLLSAGDTYAGGGTGGSADAVVVSHSHKPSGTDYPYFLQLATSVQSGDMGTQSGTGRHYPFQATSNAGKYWARGSATDPTGVSGTGKNMPPYLVVYMWQRTA